MPIEKKTFYLEVDGKVFNDEFSCLGRQLAEILTVIHHFNTSYTWFVFDVGGGSHQSIEEFFVGESKPAYFSSTEQLLTSVKEVVQFDSGVFIASDSKELTWSLEEVPHTEAEQTMQVEGSVIEIRAFDFSAFEIYTDNYSLYQVLKNRFAE